MITRLTFSAAGLLALSGCGAVGMITDVATAPVRAVKATSTIVDVATVSQSERDQKRGREIRRREERMGQLNREYQRQSEKCADGNDGACAKRDAAETEMRGLMPSVPYEPR